MANLSRIRSSSRYQEIYNRGVKVKRPFFVGYFLSQGGEQNNYGFVASKKIGGAVRRNRAKRLLREACRNAAGPYRRPGKGYDIVLVARSAINDAGFKEVREQWFSALADLSRVHN